MAIDEKPQVRSKQELDQEYERLTQLFLLAVSKAGGVHQATNVPRAVKLYSQLCAVAAERNLLEETLQDAPVPAMPSEQRPDAI